LLDRLVGRDLWTEKLTTAESAQLERLLEKSPVGSLKLWRVWKTDSNGRSRYVVLLGEDLMIVPGGTSAYVLLLDNVPVTIRRWSFQTGWRSVLKDASLEQSTDRDRDLLVIHTSPVVNGRDIAKASFSIGGDQLRLIRLEDSKGSAVQNEYVFPNFEIGLPPKAHTVQEWANLLQSKDRSDVLSALMFLGGRHIAEDERGLLSDGQSKYATLFEQLLANRSIQNLIAKLADSDDGWIREAAILAGRGPRKRLLR
jgi:hypothetical protein